MTGKLLFRQKLDVSIDIFVLFVCFIVNKYIFEHPWQLIAYVYVK
jgi:hypothetical protein